MNNLPEVTFRFRIADVDEKAGMRGAEWVFENISDTTVSFIYLLITDLHDTLSGCVTIEGKRKEYSGWLIHGDRFTMVEGTNVSVARR
jgi:hypothetical protein